MKILRRQKKRPAPLHCPQNLAGISKRSLNIDWLYLEITYLIET
jgi:hypothetical protein